MSGATAVPAATTATAVAALAAKGSETSLPTPAPIAAPVPPIRLAIDPIESRSCASREKMPRIASNGSAAITGRVARNGADRVAKPAASAEEERLDDGHGNGERRGDLLVRQSEEVAQRDCLALADRQVGERDGDLGELAPAVGRLGDVGGVGDLGDDLAVDRDRRPHALADPGATLVACDCGEPGGILARLVAAQQTAVGRDERLLRGVLRLVVIAQGEDDTARAPCSRARRRA